MKTEIETALNNYFDGKLLGQDILKVKLGDIIYGVQGVENYDIVSPENDIVTGTENLPVLGSVTISEWS